MTLTEWVASVAGITVAGLRRQYDAPPEQANPADMPLMFPRLPTIGSTVSTFGSGYGLAEVAMELVLIVKPAMLGKQSAEFTNTLGMIDALQVALNTATSDGIINTFAIRQEVIDAGGDTSYMGLVATVEGSYSWQ
jgi:hypothetical protein